MPAPRVLWPRVLGPHLRAGVLRTASVAALAVAWPGAALRAQTEPARPASLMVALPARSAFTSVPVSTRPASQVSRMW